MCVFSFSFFKPLHSFSFPREGLTYTNWDRWTVHGNKDFKLKDLLQHFKVNVIFFDQLQLDVISVLLTLFTGCLFLDKVRVSRDNGRTRRQDDLRTDHARTLQETRTQVNSPYISSYTYCCLHWEKQVVNSGVS